METPTSSTARTKDRNERRAVAPWTRGEKWLLWTAVVTITGSVCAWMWVNSLDAMPVCKVPPPQTIYPNAYNYFVAAGAQAPFQFGARIPKPNIIPRGTIVPRSNTTLADPHPETWLTRAPTPAEMQALAGAPAANAAGIAMLRQALTLPCLAPQERTFDYVRPELAQIRGLARAVRATAEVQASQGHDRVAAGTALDGIAMGVQMTHGGDNLAMIVGGAVAAIDRRPIWHIGSRLDSATARSAAQRLAKAESQREPIQNALTNQKWAMQAALMQLFERPEWRKELAIATNTQPQGNNAAPLQFVGKRNTLEEYTTFANAEIAAAQGPYVEVPYAQSGFAARVIRSFAESNQNAWFLWCESGACNRLLATTLALRVYHLDHGTYPASLQQLIPSYLPSVLEDPFSRKPLNYKRDHGTYVLYSVGPDGVDDKGKPISTGAGEHRYQVEMQSRGDIVAGLNE